MPLHNRGLVNPIVLDTNIALDLLVFDDPACAALREALHSGRCRWLASAAMRVELARVLGYPAVVSQLARRGRMADAVLAAFDAAITRVPEPPRAPCVCEDPDDQVFIDLAVAHRAQLLSKDRAVLLTRRRMAELGVAVGSVFA